MTRAPRLTPQELALLRALNAGRAPRTVSPRSCRRLLDTGYIELDPQARPPFTVTQAGRDRLAAIDAKKKKEGTP